MAQVPYDYLDQDIQATALIQVRDDDSFYNPSLGHNGFAFDGTRYTAGVQDAGPIFASWYTESAGSYRSTLQTFPKYGLILLSKVAMTILDESTRDLALWMQFLMNNTNALTNNFSGGNIGFTPQSLCYADGIVSITCVPDEGATDITSKMVITFDFSQDRSYLDVAVTGPTPP